MMKATLFTPPSSNRFADTLENALWVNGFAKEREGLVTGARPRRTGLSSEGSGPRGRKA